MSDQEKQIEEMASILENAKIDALATIGSTNHGFGVWYAQALYNAGYRKQSDGKWVLVGYGNGRAIHWKCSECGYETLDVDNGDTNFCPNCGADMRGGE